MNSSLPQPPAPAILTLLKLSLRGSCPEQALGRAQGQRPLCLSPPHPSQGCRCASFISTRAFFMPLVKPPPQPCPAGMGGSGANSGLPHRKCSAVSARDNCALKLLILRLFGLGAGGRVLEAAAQQGAAGQLKPGAALWQPGFATSIDFILPLGASLLLTKHCVNSSPARARLDLGKC